MADVMIEARGLSKRYGAVQALADVTFDVRKGEVLGFLGPNGAGKTTAMKILTCFFAPTSGSAKVNGADVFEDSLSVRRSVGYLPENTPLYTEMLTLEYLEFVAELRNIPKQERRQHIKKAVEHTGIGDVVGQNIGTLSKGYRQRVGLAQALLHEPPILILDEPMSGLDPNQAVEIRDLIKKIGRERTVILSTHNLAEVRVTCDRVLIIAGGRIVADDRPEQLQARAGKPRFVVSTLRDQTREEVVREALGKIPGVEEVRARPTSNGELTFDLTARGQEDLRPEIFKAAVRSGFVLVELTREGQNLEQVFRQLTTGSGDSSNSQGNHARQASKGSSSAPPSTQDEASREGG